MISILLVDDHPMLRQGVAQLIEMDDELSVVGQAGDGLEAIEKALALEPDMILLDLNMKGMSGLETLTELRKQGVNSKVVIFTVSDSQMDLAAAVMENADGYLLKDTEPEDLLRDIKRAANNEQVFSPQLARVMAQALRKEHQSHAKQEELTAREVSILKLIATGQTNKQIARKLEIAETTVKVHVKNLLKKLSLRSRVEAAIWAMENNIHN